MSRRAFLALGSNLGDRWAYLRRAVELLPDVVATSSVFETEPIGGPLDQGAYLNMVVELQTALTVRELLDLAHGLETEAQRVRTELNGPRTLDVDILLFGDETIDEPDLQVPHPRMWERRFVLQPLNELAPELLPPDWEDRAVGRVEVVGKLEQ